MSGEPFSKSPSEEAERREAEFRRLVGAYKATFSSEKGRTVLADLKQKFGFERCEADSELVSDNIIARRTCMKAPLFHIEKMRTHTFRKDTRPKRALSAQQPTQINPP